MPTRKADYFNAHHVYIAGWRKGLTWERRIKIGFSRHPDIRLAEQLQRRFPGIQLYRSIQLINRSTAEQTEKRFKWAHHSCREAGQREVFHLHPEEAVDNLVGVLYGYLQENPSRGEKILHFLLGTKYRT